MSSACQVIDIVQCIVAYCDARTNARNVLVCKAWSKVALDAVWSHLTSLKPLIELFGKTCSVKDDVISYEYENSPSVGALKRFETIYRSRIRTLELASDAGEFAPALSIMARIRGEGPLLPNLQSLTWSGLASGGLTEFSVMFMHGGIHSFSIISDERDTVESFASYCEAISYRMPKLRSLHLDIWPVDVYQKPILDTVQKLPHLKELTLPPFEDPSEVILGLRDSLELRLTYLGTFLYEILPQNSILSGPFRNTGFQHLSEVDLYCSYDFAARFFQNVNPLNEIRTITLTSINHQPAGNFREVMWQIASTCHHLQSLALRFKNKTRDAVDDLSLHPSPDDLIHFEDIGPLLHKCPDITDFTLEFPYVIQIDDSDVKDIAQSWPALKAFKLADQIPTLSPSFDYTKKLTLASLAHFSRYCPRIEFICLNVYATGDGIPPLSIIPSAIADSKSPGVFQNIRSFQFDSSPIDNSARVACYLAHLCSGSNVPDLVYGSVWEEGVIVDDREWVEKWETAEETFKVVLEMKTILENSMKKKELEYQKRIEELELGLTRKRKTLD